MIRAAHRHEITLLPQIEKTSHGHPTWRRTIMQRRV
jgi:hypothetical protein